MPAPVTTDASQLDADGAEASDIPPISPSTTAPSSNMAAVPNGDTSSHLTNHKSFTERSSFSIPLPPPEAGTFAKEPGHTRHTLQQLVLSTSDVSADPRIKGDPGPQHCQPTPPTSSPSVSGSEPSSPLTAPPSKPHSRAASITEEKKPPTPESLPRSSATPKKQEKPHGKAPSVASDKGEHKFTLKELLASGPKLSRKPSQRSTGSSKKSDSDGDRKSTAGDSVGSLSKKYGVCQKVAIGKGATSVVRLAHKWDRSEEKLYAVKVGVLHSPCS
jgi:protein-serine/threonine kinase